MNYGHEVFGEGTSQRSMRGAGSRAWGDANQPLLPDLVGRLAVTRADGVAYADGERSLSWAEIASRRLALTGALAELGMKQGDGTGIIASDRVELLEHWHACLVGGYVRVGINWRYSPREIDHIVQDADLRVIFIEDRFSDQLAAEIHRWRDEGRVLVGIGAGHDLEHDMRALCDHADGEPAAVGPNDTVAVSYTSGTTGWPKGAILTHGAAGAALFATALGAGLRSDDVILNNLPGSGFPIFIHTHAVAVGATTVLPTRFSAEGSLELIEQHGVTVMFCVPTMLHGIEELARVRGITNTSLRTVVTLGSPSVPAVVDRVRRTLGCEVQNWYGSTEATGAVCQLRPWDLTELSAEPEMVGRCVGRPMAHVDLVIRGEDGREVPRGAVGEICVRGAVMAGYLGRPAETAAALHHGWLRTGDLGSQDSRGFVYVTDRKKFMIISGGYNVYPAVVENALAEHPDVGEVAVVGAPHEKWGEVVVAVVVPVGERKVSATALIDYCAPRMGKWEVPKHIEFVEELPKGTTGKVQKSEIRQWFDQRPELLPWNS
ncbi:class I adenylate-forming enzyme family protein [Nocardia vaccinii]|uniref:class I adenylate-forming enzyme family protein n=1 Tax=Nocardia vaccinii TaxID=1822 RepID=UPI0008313CD7|nr:AMP-binding protein [Nocardia vaccinii]